MLSFAPSFAYTIPTLSLSLSPSPSPSPPPSLSDLTLTLTLTAKDLYLQFSNDESGGELREERSESAPLCLRQENSKLTTKSFARARPSLIFSTRASGSFRVWSRRPHIRLWERARGAARRGKGESSCD